MSVRDLTPEEAIAYALDPRNDSGEPSAFHVMAQNYDPDCPNHDDHEIVDGVEVCRCWDGITSEDVATWTEDDKTNVAGFAEWGPFQLWYEGDDPGPARGPTIDEALDIVERFMEVISEYTHGQRPDVSRAMEAIITHRKGERENPYDEELDIERFGTCPGSGLGEEGNEPKGHIVSSSLCCTCLQYID